MGQIRSQGEIPSDRSALVVERLEYGQIGEKWGDIRRLVNVAVATTHGRQTEDYMLFEVLTGAIQIWTVQNKKLLEYIGVLSTRIINYPNKKMLSVQLCAGKNMESWLEDLIDKVEEFAKANGCDGVEGLGRFGWNRVLKDKGYSQTDVFIEKNF